MQTMVENMQKAEVATLGAEIKVFSKVWLLIIPMIV
jgi:hypothetical protein